MNFLLRRWIVISLLPVCWFGSNAEAAPTALKLVTQYGYLPANPVLVRVEALAAGNQRDRDLWDAEVVLAADSGVTLSPNRVTLRNGLGSALVSCSGGGDFTLTATLGSLTTNRVLKTLAGVPVTTIGGTLPGSSTTWSNIVNVTNNLVVPAGHTLTILSNTLVLLNGVASGSGGAGFVVQGRVQSVGTEDRPVTFTCANPAQNWGELRHTNATLASSQLSRYQHTAFTKAGRSASAGHTGTGPVFRLFNASNVLEHCTLSDLVGKSMYASGSEILLTNCHLARSIMGPEITGSGIQLRDTWVTDMFGTPTSPEGTNDNDGIYLLNQQAGQSITLSGCVLAGGHDDAVDTLGSTVTLTNCIVRDWPNPNEDAKGISCFDGTVNIRRCLFANCFVGVAMKTSSASAVGRVNLSESTILGVTKGLLAAVKANAPGPIIDFRVTNCIVRAPDAIATDFGPTNFTIGYCALPETWPGTGNITEHPLFIDEPASNFRLWTGSPCINTGNPAGPLDPDSSRADMGYFPFNAAQAVGLFVAITAPPESAVFTAPTNVVLDVQASSTTGTLARVDFYQAVTKLGEDTASPYTFTWTNPPAGIHTLKAIGFDTTGASKTSAPVNITVNSGASAVTNTLIGFGSVWTYLDDGSDQGTGWVAPSFDDSLWASGPAQLGYGDNDEATVVSFGPNSASKFVTTYFRRSFPVSGAANYTNLSTRLLRDDGGVVYLNGVEVYRSGNMGTDPVAFDTLANATGENSIDTFNIDPALLVEGPNLLAVELHQQSGTSSDLSFDLGLLGIAPPQANPKPLVSITAPAEGSIYGTPASFNIVALASDADGSVTNVTFRANNTKLADTTVSPYTYSWNNPAAGSYALTAVATDNAGQATTSSVVNIVVSANVAAPVVAGKTPAPGPLTNLTQINVIFSKTVAGVQASDLLINGVPAAALSGSGSNYTFGFPQPPAGTISITWAAAHGIADTFIPAHPFATNSAGANWQYQLQDASAPIVSRVSPVPGSTVSALSSINVTFSENVSGVNAADLRVNSTPAASVTGSGAGPYTFTFSQPAGGPVLFSWATGHGIVDPIGNALVTFPWAVTLDTNSFPIVLSEIMYHPASENVLDEWIELHNKGTSTVNLHGWQFTGGVQFTFSNVTLNAGAYLVVAADRARFLSSFPAVPNVVGNWTGFLNNSSEDIDLDDAAGRRVDSVRYADEGDWAKRQRGFNDGGFRGWDWLAEHDGLGKSLELINPDLSNNEGQNWAASRSANGTPGAGNSVRTNNVAPLILQTLHTPLIPRSTDPILITVRLVDEAPGGQSGLLFYRASVASPPAFSSTPLRDDGSNGDAAAGDGIYSAQLPAQANHTVIEFYLSASDLFGVTRTWPGPAVAASDGVGPTGQVANALFQVDDTVYNPTNNQPLYKLVMTEAERAELQSIPGASNLQGPNAQMNGTFISVDAGGTALRYLAAFRNRGHGSRSANPPNYHINFRSDDPWKDVTALNLNVRYVHLQHIGSILARKSGVAGMEAIAVQVRVNNQNRASGGSPMFGSYVANEAIGGEWADKHFPADGNGNVYRVVRDIGPPDLSYRGEDQNSYTNTYFKESNVSEDNWTDLIGMLRVVGINNAVSFTTENVRQVVNVEQWMRHLAFMAIVGNNESGLNTGFNDDYFMYAGIQDPRFILSYWDLDTIIGSGDSPMSATSSIYTSTANNGSGLAIDRFLRHPDFEPIYLRTLQELLDTVFAPTNFNATLDLHLGGYVPPGNLSPLKNWMAQRRSHILTQFLASVPPAVTAPLATLTGAPRSPTPVRSASLIVGGSGVVAYRAKIDAGAYGAETAVGTPINLSNLANGTHTVSVIGKDADGLWQDPTNATTRSWVVNTAWPAVRLNEVLARNDTAVNHAGTFPDVVELFNEGTAAVDLSGLRLTDDPANPSKFTFPASTSLAAGAYLTVYANNADGTGGFHLGFSLDQEGESIYLFDRVANGSNVLDSVSFGLQLSDLSVGRVAGGDWVLTQPTFGSANIVRAVGDPRLLKLNEWLAAALPPYPDDFIELYNPQSQPVAVGGLHLTDQPIGAPALHTIAPLSFIAANGFLAFLADGDAGQGASHVNFGLAYETGEIGLTAADGSVIDCIIYGPQLPGVASGRCPDGGLNQRSLTIPTPGSPNACPVVPPASQVVTLLDITNIWKYENSGGDLGTDWLQPAFDDTSWSNGPALLAVENCNCLPEPIRTPLSVASGKITFYFRTRFNVAPNLNVSRLELSHVIDDGAIIYLNGVEVHRTNMPAGPVTFTTQASGSVGDASYQGPFVLPLASLNTGENVFAVEVHQNGMNSSDVVFGLKLEGVTVTNTPALAGVVINEVLANNASLEEPDGSRPDWVEIYNPSLSAVDLGDMSLTDDSLTPRRWVFPAGSFVPAQGYFKARLDGSAPPSSTNTGFGLKANGGAVYLFNRVADGAGPASAVSYGLQAADWSLGCIPDGSTNLVLTQPTLGGANLAASLGDVAQLKVNEWMAAPFSGQDWFEICNPNPQPVDLSGLWLSDDFGAPQKYQIPPRSFLGAGPNGYVRFWAADGAEADFTGFSLRASGEAVLISYASGALLNGYGFGSQLDGVSQGRLPDGTGSIASFPLTPTPENSNFLPLNEVVINEVLTHSDPPLEDAVELRNIGAELVDVSGWYLSDSQDNLFKYRIPAGTTIPAGGFKVFYEYQFNFDNQDVPFSFSSAKGDEVYLSEASAPGVLTGYRAFAVFGAAENGVSFGRHQTSVGADFTVLSARTFGVDNPATTTQFRAGTGKTNVYPKVGPIVLNEIMYHQPSTNDALEFVELHNLLGTAVPLYDPANPQNTWRLRKGIDFNFPPGLSIPAGGYLVLVSFDPATAPAALAAFQAAYGTGMTLVGPYSGKLDNAGEAVEVQKPDAPQTLPGPDFGLVPYIVVDRVVYGEAAPWPPSADGLGDALKRNNASLYGNDPVNWTGGPPTPGASNFGGSGNTPPVLASIGNKSVNEGALLSFTASASDSDDPPQTLTFSLDAGAPSDASLTANGNFTWTPNETRGPGVYSVTIRVSDNGAPVQSDFETINITVNELNSAPTLNPIGNKIGNEGALITFTATALDADDPAQTLTYSLDAGAPPTASMTAAGLFTWTPGEPDGPGVYTLTVRVTDNGSPPLNDFETISITVNETNNAPVLGVIGNRTVNEGSPLAFTATATDSDQPGQTLTFTLDAGAPTGATITAAGAFSWTPIEPQGPGTNAVTIRVTDSGTPPLNDFETITIIVNESNTVPSLTVPGPQTVNELATLTVTNIASDGDLPPQSLTFALVSAPTGVNLHPTSGVLTWSPTEAQGPFTHPITLRLFDGGTPSLSRTQSFMVTVNEVNVAPVLDPIGSKVVLEGSLLAFNASATDSDSPAQTLTYRLDAGAPAGASISSAGAFTWTPTPAQGPSNYTVTVRVTDDGSPPLDDFETINISVTDPGSQLVLLNITNAWKYLDTGTNLGTVWKETGFNDAAWPSGRALLYNETAATAAPKNTQLSLNALGGGRIITYYFRTHFNFPADASGVLLTASNVLDDGAIVYLNGAEAARINMPAGLVTNGTFSAASWEGNVYSVTNVSAANLVSGDNVLAVEVHQQSATSSDVVFGLALSALVPSQTPISIISQPASSTVTAGSPAQFSVTATGSFPLYQWLKNGVPVPGANSAAYSIANAQSGDAGTYSVIVSNLVSSLTSSNATLTVNPPVNSAPVLAAIGNKTASEGVLLAFTASASDPEAPPQTLTFSLDSGAPLGAVLTANGAFTWTPNELQGGAAHSVTIRVRDGGAPELDDFETISITVNEVNTAPVLDPIGDRLVTEGTLLSFTASASDADLPTQRLAFSLDPGAPVGSSINSTNGLFTWTPPVGYTPVTNLVTLRVTDNGTSALSDSETIRIVLAGAPRVTSITAVPGGVVTIRWASVAGKNYRVEYKNVLSAATWTQLGGVVPAVGPTTSATDNMGTNPQRFYRVLLVD